MGSSRSRRCVVTGASGLVGSHLLPQLLADGWEVHAVSHSRPAGRDQEGVTWHALDLSGEWSEADLPEQVDAVVYLAQSEHFREFPERALDVFRVNTLGALRLMDYARRAGTARFVFASSGGVYGTGDDDFSEDSAIPAHGDLGFYLGTKLCSEILAENYASLLDVVILRFFFVYGPGQRSSMLVPRLVESVRQGTPIRLQGRGGLRLNPIHVADAVRAVCRALELNGSHKINVGGPEVLTLRQIGDTIGGLVGREPVYEVDEVAVPGHLVGGIERMSRLLCPPQVRFADGIAALIGAPGAADPVHAVRARG